MCQPSWHARANTDEMISLGLIAKRQGLIANHLGLIDVPQVLLNLPYCSKEPQKRETHVLIDCAKV